MLISILFGGLIFTYAGWTIYRHLKKSKEGECAGCPDKNSCNMAACRYKEEG